MENIYFYPADDVDESSVEYLEEAIRLLKSVIKDEGEPLVFNDSRKKDNQKK